MDPLNPELFKLNSVVKRRPEMMKPPPRHRQGEKFLKGPIPWDWITTASKFSGKGKALHTAIACWFLAGRINQRTIDLSHTLLREMGVNRNAAYRGLEVLEELGLVSVVRRNGCCPRVTINDFQKGDRHQQL